MPDAALVDLIHAKARDHFNVEGATLLQSVVRLPALPTATSSFLPDVFSTTTVTQATIEGDMQVSHRTPSGDVLSLLCSNAGGWFGLVGDGLQALMKLSIGLQRLPPIRA